MRKLRKNINHKLIVIAVILSMLISVGYAALSTTLSINGTASISSSSWLVYFTNVQVTTGSVMALQTPTTSGTSTTNLTWEVNLDNLGDFYEYYVDVKNDGTMDAMIGNLSNTPLTSNQAKYLDYKVTYADGAVIEQYDRLDSGDMVTLKVRVEYKTDLNPEDLPSEPSSVVLTCSSNYVQADDNAKDRNTISNINLGDTINYTTSINGVTLDSWKVFSIDGDYTIIILDDYLPNSAIDTSSVAFSNLNKSNTYGISSKSNRMQLLNAMLTKTNWTSLLTGTINGTPIDYSETIDTNIWAMGSPTLEMYVNSWNTRFTDNILYTATTASAMSDGLNGYYIGTDENPTSYFVYNFSTDGYDDPLYYPYQELVDSCHGYWLASPSAVNDDSVMGVGHNDSVGSDGGEYNMCFRPIISLPSNILASHGGP